MLCYIRYMPVSANWFYVGGTLSKLSQVVNNSCCQPVLSACDEPRAQPEVKAHGLIMSFLCMHPALSTLCGFLTFWYKQVPFSALISQRNSLPSFSFQHVYCLTVIFCPRLQQVVYCLAMFTKNTLCTAALLLGKDSKLNKTKTSAWPQFFRQPQKGQNRGTLFFENKVCLIPSERGIMTPHWECKLPYSRPVPGWGWVLDRLTKNTAKLSCCFSSLYFVYHTVIFIISFLLLAFGLAYFSISSSLK